MQRRISRICSLHSTQRRVAKWLADALSRQGRGEAVDHMQVLGLAPVQPVCMCVCGSVCVCAPLGELIKAVSPKCHIMRRTSAAKHR